ncbi:MAG: LPS export ABC transporter periplasmic protein LptC [Gammaproteobacteria bacterium]
MNTRLTVTALTLLLVAVLVGVLNRQEYVPGATSRGGDDRDAFIEDMSLAVMDDSGQAVYRMTADTVTHLASTDLLELHNPLVNIIRPDGSRWQITAARGEAAVSGDRVWLPGVVDLRRSADSRQGAMHISARDVLVKPTGKLVETDGKAVITTDRFRVETIGFKADLNTNRLYLRSNVRGRINGAG